MAAWYSGKSKLSFRDAVDHREKYRFAESIAASQDAIEFGVKAMLEFGNASYSFRGPQGHEAGDALAQLNVRFPQLRTELARAALVSKKWMGTRTVSRYGEQALKVSPKFRSQEARDACQDSKRVVETLSKIERDVKFEMPVRVGVLDGYVVGKAKRERAVGVHLATAFGTNDWVAALNAVLIRGQKVFQAEPVSAAELGNQFAVILNPYGEVYPELNLTARPIFNKIKDFVWSGGLLVNAGGFAFFYAWDVRRAAYHPVTSERVLMPKNIDLSSGNVQLEELLGFGGSLLWSDLGGVTTADTSTWSGPFPGEAYQRSADRARTSRILPGATVGSIREFRALTKRSSGVIPLVRLNRKQDFGEVFPIAALPHGWGYFVIAGMELQTPSDMSLLSSVLAGFVEHLRQP